MPKVVIVGGGIAGLSASYELRKANVEHILIERRPRLGGVIETRRRDGCVLEAGPEAAHAVRQWSHVRMFSPWEFNIDKAAERLLKKVGWNAPAASDYPTGGELVAQYLEPLATRTALKDGIKLEAGDIVDGTFMSKAALTAFLDAQVARAKAEGVLFSLHLKATMMKVSDPIIFGHALKSYFAPVFEKYADDLASCGADPDDGLGLVLAARPVLAQWHHVNLLHVAVPLLASMALIRVVFYALRTVMVPGSLLANSERIVAALVWAVVRTAWYARRTVI